jgi:hypothetical protein
MARQPVRTSLIRDRSKNSFLSTVDQIGRKTFPFRVGFHLLHVGFCLLRVGFRPLCVGFKFERPQGKLLFFQQLLSFW